MITSKPKRVTLFSLSLFLVLAYGAGTWSWIRLPSTPMIWLLVPLICYGSALIVTFKLLISYRVLVIKGDKWQVNRLIGSNVKFSGNEILWWNETIINTAGSAYKQLHIHAGEGKNVKVSLQEHTDYEKVLKGLKSNHHKKQIKQP